jgi:hypothetical protein
MQREYWMTEVVYRDGKSAFLFFENEIQAKEYVDRLWRAGHTKVYAWKL